MKQPISSSSEEIGELSLIKDGTGVSTMPKTNNEEKRQPNLESRERVQGVGKHVSCLISLCPGYDSFLPSNRIL